MPEEQKEKKVELTFDQKLVASGWAIYYTSASGEDLDNPNETYGTLGFSDALGRKQVIVTLPAREWVRLLTPMAKKAAKA